MENSASAKYTKGVHHFKFNYSETKDLQPEQFISSLVFDALGNEWVIDCYPRGPCEDMLRITLFLVRPHREYKTMNPTISLRFVNRDGTKHTLPIEYLQGDITDLYRVALQQSLFQGLVFTFIYNSSLVKHFVKDGSFELICNLDNTEILHNRCFLGVPKSFDLHSQIGQLMESTETADVTFCIENRSFMCHRIVLTARSPVFKAELFGNMAEATQKRIKIEDMSPEVFEAMLHFIYTDSFPCCDSEKSSTKMAQHLFVSADRYAIEGLKALCEDKLCAHISFDMVTATWLYITTLLG